MTGIRSQQPIHPRGSAGGYPLAPWLILGASAGALAAAWQWNPHSPTIW